MPGRVPSNPRLARSGCPAAGRGREAAAEPSWGRAGEGPRGEQHHPRALCSASRPGSRFGSFGLGHPGSLNSSLPSGPVIGSAAQLAGAPPGTGGRGLRFTGPPGTAPPALVRLPPPRRDRRWANWKQLWRWAPPRLLQLRSRLASPSGRRRRRQGGRGEARAAGFPGAICPSDGEARADARSGTQNCGQSFTQKGGRALCPPRLFSSEAAGLADEESWFRGRGLREAPRARRTRCCGWKGKRAGARRLAAGGGVGE